jgi:23S rRNA G2069 N7-methylase RlmK/C1962 C5-methylase RlmI
LLNGEGDLLPGLVCDVYGSSAVLKLDGDGPTQSLNHSMTAHPSLFSSEQTQVFRSVLPAVCLLLPATLSFIIIMLPIKP